MTNRYLLGVKIMGAVWDMGQSRTVTLVKTKMFFKELSEESKTGCTKCQHVDWVGCEGLLPPSLLDLFLRQLRQIFYAIIDQCLYIHTHLWYRKNPTAILVFALLILINVSLNTGRHRFLLIQFEYQSILRLFRSFFWVDGILIYYLLTNLTSSSGEFQICFVMRCVFFKCCSNKVCSWSPVL